MKTIFSIYRTDLRNIVTNWAAAIIILGLIILPSLYAWFNIKASWDPYGNTAGISIAVTNKDKGATIQGRKIQVGEEIIASLKTNKQLGWTFVDESTALRGVQHGEYYASITIPEDFSAKIATVLTDEPTKAEILYYVNEKSNAIAPKITSKGASGIIEQVNSNFVKVANGVIFRIFNELGVELEKELPTIQKVVELIFLLEKHFPEMEKAVNVALNDAQKAQEIVQTAQNTMPIVEQLAKDGEQLTVGIGQLLEHSEDAYTTLKPLVKQELQLLQEAAQSAEELTGILQDAKIDTATLQSTVDRVSLRLMIGAKIASSLSHFLGHLDQSLPGHPFRPAAAKFDNLGERMSKQLALIETIEQAVKDGKQPAKDLVNQLHTLSQDTSAFLDTLMPYYDTVLEPQLAKTLDTAKHSAENAQTVLQEVNRTLPEIERILTDAQNGLVTGTEKIEEIHEALPGMKAKITQAADKIRAFQAQENLNEMIDLLKNNYEKTSRFFAEPVVLKENKFFPIPNYGSAMSPFFSTLSLWVGALLLVSLLTVELHGHEAPLKSFHIYFGRFLTFLTIALLQSLVVTTGDMYVLGTYVADKLWFVLFGLVISAVFMLIVYTLVSVFGNVGKAMAIILLVLQLAGSGGTFPIQLTPAFFQAINPFLPFTYAISMMREAVGGVLWDIVQRDLFMLAFFASIFLVIGLALKKIINRSSARLVNKAKESKLIH
ncbi:YhgE/Pip domain-containing protein [Brevibacillus migulae]|uniref:YhgE/Pip domain-containing protein n=1 Tax=Brevibacillus migulae TaxID=1644114 RepID=UPI00106EC59C|nr:YhgE/Pip domain-containing protein [Brevibacillus migulae]